MTSVRPHLASALPTLALLLSAPAARADVVITVNAPGVQHSLAPGAVTETFNELAPGSYTSIHSAIGTYTAAAPGGAVVPPDEYGGADQTKYLAVGAQSSPVTEVDLTFNGPVSYFGLYWSAMDSQNKLEMFNGSTLLETVTEATLASMLTHTGGPNGTGHYGNPNTGQDPGEPFAYVNLTGTAGTTFTEVKFLNNGTGTGFESDNHSIVSAVPEPGSLALAGAAGLVGLAGAWLRRRRSA